MFDSDKNNSTTMEHTDSETVKFIKKSDNPAGLLASCQRAWLFGRIS